jgi:putative transposase
MPNHLHMIFTRCGIMPERDMQFVKGGSSDRAKRDLGMRSEVQERGYVDHRIRDADDYAKDAAYIRQNPVEARLVKRAEDYPYSSANVRIDLDPCPQGLKPRISKSA